MSIAALASAVALGLTAVSSSPRLLHTPQSAAAAKVSPITLVSLTFRNRGLDSEHVSLPPAATPTGFRVLRPSDIATWSDEGVRR